MIWRNKTVVGVLVAMLSGGDLYATKFKEITVDDPFSNNTCPAAEILSYGSYIYNAASKFDGVFWPATEKSWLWLCPESGYSALGNDFGELSDAEHVAIGEFLAQNYDPKKPPTDPISRLSWMEEIYRLRDKDAKFWAYFYRLQAYWHDREKKPAAAMEYRRMALPLMKQLLRGLPAGQARIQCLFLAGEYSRQLGDVEDARQYFHDADNTVWVDDDGKKQTGHPYFRKLIEGRMQLLQGQ